MKKIGLLAIALAVSSVAVSAPNTYRNEKWGFETTYPAGWVTAELPGVIAVTAIAPPPEEGVFCNTTAEKVALTQKMTQPEINKQNQESFPPQFWMTNIYGGFTNISIERFGQRNHPSGISIQEAVAAFDKVENGQTYRAKGHTAIFITPGETFSMTCLMLESKFEKYRNDVASTIDSFRRSKGGLSADINAAAPSVVNVLNLNMPSLAAGASAGVDATKVR